MRFNPNLYKIGKVSLSLLGTWAGPLLVANKSTLLQVLISIQSLIFVNDPYFNGPTFEGQEGTKHGKSKCKTYNDNNQKGIISYGVNDHIERLVDANKESLYPEFDDVLVCMIQKTCSTIEPPIVSSEGTKQGPFITEEKVEQSLQNLALVIAMKRKISR